MVTLDELLRQAEHLPAVEKWKLVKHVLRSLEEEQIVQPATSDWHEFLRSTYGSLKDTPIQRWDQGEYEEREPLE
ncbi:MAG: hypothetical protein L6Q98_20150 [Anaerolineae bacterium]|nr:hypothetical protein [Anaerolineae bacterium]NUQ05770.1 hypothetical protein [Anaerolineae bacterium]